MIKYVVHHNGLWAVKNAKADRVTKTFSTQKDAIHYAASLESTTTIMVQSRTGAFRALSKWDLIPSDKKTGNHSGVIDNRHSSYYWKKHNSNSFSGSTEAQAESISKIVNQMKKDSPFSHSSKNSVENNSNFSLPASNEENNNKWNPVVGSIPGFTTIPTQDEEPNEKLLLKKKDIALENKNQTNNSDSLLGVNSSANVQIQSDKIKEVEVEDNKIPKYNANESIVISEGEIRNDSLIAPTPEPKKKMSNFKLILLIFIGLVILIWIIYSVLVAYDIKFAIDLYNKLPLSLQIIK